MGPGGSGTQGEDFASVLAAAIGDRGLSLSRVVARLAAQGHTVTPATLSNWQRGRSAPRMPGSRPLLEAIDLVLDLPIGTLARHAEGISGTGGARVDSATGPPPDEEFQRACAQLGILDRASLSQVTQVRRFTLHPSRVHLTGVITTVWRCEGGLAETAWVDIPPLPEGPAEVVGLSMCRVSENTSVGESGRLIGRLDLASPLAPGEYLQTQVAIHPQNPREPWNEVMSTGRHAPEQAILIVEFEGAIPREIRCVALDDREPAREIESDVMQAYNGKLQVIHHQVTPFGFGFRWSW